MAPIRISLLDRKAVYHKLKKNDIKSIPDKIIVFDTESKQEQIDNKQFHTLRLAWLCELNKRNADTTYTEKWYLKNDAEDICKYLDSRFTGKSCGYIVGHNIFFDLQVIQFFYFFPQYGWKLRFWYEQGLTYACIIQRDQTRVKIISTTNFFATSLKKIGEIVGLPKQEVDFDNCTDDELSIYCRNDVEITKRIFMMYIDFCLEHNLGKFAITRASQSMHAFRHRFMDHDIVFHQDKTAIEHERLAYMGGRTEAFKIGKLNTDRYVTLDINSMYPYVMKYNPLPTRLIEATDNYEIERLKYVFNKWCMIAHVDLETDEPAYALRTKEKIIYPIGKFSTYLCTTGMFYAWNNGHLKKIHRIQFYDKDFIFEKYIDYFWSVRRKYLDDGNTTFATFCKVFMNSLYGKFGQRSYTEEYTHINDPSKYYRIENFFIDKKRTEIETCFMNTLINNGDEEINKNAFVAIPAHITEDSRFLLWSIIKEIGRSRVLYCDTDSVKIRAKDVCRIESAINNSMLGMLKVERIDKNMTIYGCKDYVCDELVKLKGVPVKSRALSQNVFEYGTWGTQKYHLREQESKKFIVRTTIKTLARNYDKGLVDQYGRITPFCL